MSRLRIVERAEESASEPKLVAVPSLPNKVLSIPRQLGLFSAMFSSVFWIMDFVGLIQLARKVIEGGPLPPFDEVLAQIVMLTVFFFFGTGMYVWLNSNSDKLTRIVLICSWAYISLAAIIMIGLSYHFFVDGSYDIADRVGYISLVSIMALLGFILADITKQHTPYFMAPFLLVALAQGIIWSVLTFFGNNKHMGPNLVGDLLLMTFSGLLIVFFYEPSLVLAKIAQVSSSVQERIRPLRGAPKVRA